MKNFLNYVKQGNNFLSVSLGIGVLLTAVSIFYSILIKPIMNRISLDNCLDSVQVQKIKQTISAYDLYLRENPFAVDTRIGQKEVNNEEAKCYDRYK